MVTRLQIQQTVETQDTPICVMIGRTVQPIVLPTSVVACGVCAGVHEVYKPEGYKIMNFYAHAKTHKNGILTMKDYYCCVGTGTDNEEAVDPPPPVPLEAHLPSLKS
jgi:hypothetical protein